MSKTVVIVGAGVIGCAIALQLGRKGYKTINVDKNPEVGYGSTSNSCAVVRFSYSSIATTALAYEGYHYWKDWENFLGVNDERGLAEYHQCGHLMLKHSPDDRIHVLKFYEELGIPYEEWDNATISERLPVFNLNKCGPVVPVDDPEFWEESSANGEIAGGVFVPAAGYIGDPSLATHNLRRAVEAAGGVFKLGRRVVGVNRSDKGVSSVELDDGEKIAADVVVNAAGPYSGKINEMAGVLDGMAIKTKALRREVHHLPSPPDFDFERKGVMTSDDDLYLYFRPETGNKVTIGSGDPPCDPQVWVDDPDDFDRGFTESQWNAQVYRAARRIPELPIPNNAAGVVDLYDVSDDWIPIYDCSDLPGYYMAVGTSGHQFKNAGVVGDLMAELIDACENGLDHDQEPLQYECTYIDQKIDLGVFSRRRKIHRESSFSVRG
ncbi:NAD(P)/FAD-dependent oxidoreductase [Hyphococcus sp.]|uniref:NAD(P)/FAD-dependent oxidoreductase n=1 Tax=Hyphococcus sp. TaxID=2038636 RepID=UPI003CCBD07B